MNRKSRVRQVSVAALLISMGVILGTAAPRARGAAPVARPSAAAGARARAEVPPPAPIDTSSAAATPDITPQGIRPEGDPPTFGGSYAVLRGASTDGSVPVDAQAEEVGAPQTFPPVPREIAEGTAPADPGVTPEPTTRPAPAPFRPAPAQGIPRGVAADYPLLAVFEGAGRLLFYDLGVRPGVIPASIEGSWSSLGDCGRALQADFSAPTGRAGELRAVGRGAPGESGSAVVVAARQGCESASRRFASAHVARAGDAGELAGLAPEGFGGPDLVQVARSGEIVVAVFRSRAGSAAVIATSTTAGLTSAWSARVPAADGDLAGIGVFRRSGAAYAWFVIRKGARATALLTASSSDGQAWSSSGPAALANR
jgi:hypothetical protein